MGRFIGTPLSDSSSCELLLLLSASLAVFRVSLEVLLTFTGEGFFSGMGYFRGLPRGLGEAEAEGAAITPPSSCELMRGLSLSSSGLVDMGEHFGLSSLEILMTTL